MRRHLQYLTVTVRRKATRDVRVCSKINTSVSDLMTPEENPVRRTPGCLSIRNHQHRGAVATTVRIKMNAEKRSTYTDARAS